MVSIGGKGVLWRSGVSAQMSEIENVGQTWMALNTSKCNHLTVLHKRVEYACYSSLKKDYYGDSINDKQLLWVSR